MSDRGDHGGDDLSLPKATVQKIVSEIIPPDLVFSRETRDALIECCIEFIMILTTESNDIAEKESKTIACEHVLKALETLGFYDYIEPIKGVIAQHKEAQRVRERKVGKLEQSGRSEEDLMREQELLFGKARSKLQNSQQQQQQQQQQDPPSSS